jgi:hypothetical protein
MFPSASQISGRSLSIVSASVLRTEKEATNSVKDVQEFRRES